MKIHVRHFNLSRNIFVSAFQTFFHNFFHRVERIFYQLNKFSFISAANIIVITLFSRTNRKFKTADRTQIFYARIHRIKIFFKIDRIKFIIHRKIISVTNCGRHVQIKNADSFFKIHFACNIIPRSFKYICRIKIYFSMKITPKFQKFL